MPKESPTKSSLCAGPKTTTRALPSAPQPWGPPLSPSPWLVQNCWGGGDSSTTQPSQCCAFGWRQRGPRGELLWMMSHPQSQVRSRGCSEDKGLGVVVTPLGAARGGLGSWKHCWEAALWFHMGFWVGGARPRCSAGGWDEALLCPLLHPKAQLCHPVGSGTLGGMSPCHEPHYSRDTQNGSRWLHRREVAQGTLHPQAAPRMSPGRAVAPGPHGTAICHLLGATKPPKDTTKASYGARFPVPTHIPAPLWSRTLQKRPSLEQNPTEAAPPPPRPPSSQHCYIWEISHFKAVILVRTSAPPIPSPPSLPRLLVSMQGSLGYFYCLKKK